MKTLFVLRHAKSSWDHPHLADFERPLNPRGEKAAPFMGGFMNGSGLVPELIISSPAVRARTTAELVSGSGRFGAELRLDERIYGAGANSLVYIINEIEEVYEKVMIVGHNPGFEYLVNLLTGRGPRMPTAALAVIDLDVDSWTDVGPGKGALRDVFYPKDVMKG